MQADSLSFLDTVPKYMYHTSRGHFTCKSSFTLQEILYYVVMSGVDIMTRGLILTTVEPLRGLSDKGTLY